jgi:hypothetical protein
MRWWNALVDLPGLVKRLVALEKKLQVSDKIVGEFIDDVRQLRNSVDAAEKRLAEGIDEVRQVREPALPKGGYVNVAPDIAEARFEELFLRVHLLGYRRDR